MKVRELLQLLADDRWYLVRTRGSHQQYKHPTKAGLVPSRGTPATTSLQALNSILEQAGLKT